MAAEQDDEPRGKYARLPDPVRPEDMRTSADVVDHPDEGNAELREVAWLIRTTGGI
jgi:hypothetical protein